MNKVRTIILFLTVLLVWSVPSTFFYSTPAEAHVHDIDTIVEFENVESYPIIIYVFEEVDPVTSGYGTEKAILQAVSYQDTIQLPLVFTEGTRIFAFSDMNDNGILDKNEAGIPLEPVATGLQATPGYQQQRQTLIRMQFETF